MSLYFHKYPVIDLTTLIGSSTGERRANLIRTRAQAARLTWTMNRRAWRLRFTGTKEEQRQRRARLAIYGVRVVS